MLSWVTIIFCSAFFLKSVQKVVFGFFSTLHLAVIVFFAMQVVPLFVENIFGYDDAMYMLTNVYDASTNLTVHIVYCFFCCLTVCSLYGLAVVYDRNSSKLFFVDQKVAENNFILEFVLVLGVFSPVFACFFAPDPSIYVVFGRFYKNTYNSMDVSFLYYMLVLRYFNYISFLSVILLYFFNEKRNLMINVVVFFGIFLFSWLDGKRTLLTFALLAILTIDIIRKRYQNKKMLLVVKIFVFMLVAVLFFVLYKNYTGKGADSEFLSHYNQYFSRMGCVKTAIYSILENKPIVEYPGQTLLFNLFFYVPRGFWHDKPAMFCKYFTAYALNHKVTDFFSWNLLVNMWSEFIANLGILGYFLAMSIVGWLAKVTDMTNNGYVRLWGMLLVLLYFMFGFEYLIFVIYILFVISYAIQKIKERF